MTEHPFTNLPEGAVVSKDKGGWEIELGGPFVSAYPLPSKSDVWQAAYWFKPHERIEARGSTPDAAFQALRQAVKELANDLGVG